WSLDVQGDTSGNDWMTECECLVSSALHDLWNEEVSFLVKPEMQWSINSLNHKPKPWLSHMDTCDFCGLTGHTCYAAQQSHIYHQLAGHAED
ncbi:uncharacterized protein EDB91DRAFT_1013215, partial [Suillus paluster]|uniref:uncharacterized protein n=1 Tax=Suillus paluster TaxID=48578 RepID=UPI001B85FEB6